MRCLILVVCGLLGCAGPSMVIEKPILVEGIASTGSIFIGGLSGLVQIDGDTYLAIHDAKTHEDEPRLALMEVRTEAAPTMHPLTVDDWKHPDGRSSDLEAGCAVPGTSDEYLVVEAGDWKGDFARLFHIKINTASLSADVMGVAELPQRVSTNETTTGDQIEGMACTSAGDGHVLVVLGERGGSQAYPNGILRWATFNLETHELAFSDDGENGLPVNAPGEWSNLSSNRDIADLYLDADGVLWSVGTEDFGDDGPFISLIYKAGELTGQTQAPIKVYPSMEVWREVAGFKIEALSGAPAFISGSTMSFGTEDENYGGSWRVIR